MTTQEIKILNRLKKNQDLTDKQIEYVKEYIEPKYENNCGHCRLNTLMYLGLSHEEAFKVLDPAGEEQ